MQAQTAAPIQPEITTGLRFLGQPLGSVDFANQFLNKALSTYTTNLSKLRAGLNDRHTQSLLFRCCAQPSLTHLLNADFYYNAPLVPPEDMGLFHWSSNFTNGVLKANNDFIAFLTAQPVDSIPTLASTIANTPTSDGGFGLRDPSVTTIPLMLLSFLRSIQSATRGCLIGSKSKRLPMDPSCAGTFLAWESSAKRPFALFRSYAPMLIHGHNSIPKQQDPLSTVSELITCPINGLSSKLYSYHMTTQLAILSDPESDPDTAALFPSIMSPLTSIPLTLYHRQIKDNRLPNHIFQILLQRKLNLPLTSLPWKAGTICPLCPNNKILDAHGHHLFTCAKCHKGIMHNHMRDSLLVMLQGIAPLAGWVPSKHAVTRETPIPDTSNRPSDVGLRIFQDALKDSPAVPVSLLAIDTTVTSSPTSEFRTRHRTPTQSVHLTAQKNKLVCKQYNNPGTPAPYWCEQFYERGLLRLPFSVDPFLGLGHFAHQFLYGNTNNPPLPLPPKFDNFLYPVNKLAFDLTQTHPIRLFQKADSNPTVKKNAVKPSLWATRSIALNFSVAIAEHILRSNAQIQALIDNSGAAPAAPSILGPTSPPSSRPSKILDPLPHYLTPQDDLN